MSLSSGKARVAGDWDMSDYVGNSMNTQSDGDWQSTTSTYNAGVMTSANSWYDSGNSTTSTVAIDDASWNFTKDGTFTKTWNTTTVDVQTILGFTTTTTSVSTNNSSGNSSFAGKLKALTKTKSEWFLMF
jgi:hypothetical protein